MKFSQGDSKIKNFAEELLNIGHKVSELSTCSDNETLKAQKNEQERGGKENK